MYITDNAEPSLHKIIRSRNVLENKRTSFNNPLCVYRERLRSSPPRQTQHTPRFLLEDLSAAVELDSRTRVG